MVVMISLAAFHTCVTRGPKTMSASLPEFSTVGYLYMRDPIHGSKAMGLPVPMRNASI